MATFALSDVLQIVLSKHWKPLQLSVSLLFTLGGALFLGGSILFIPQITNKLEMVAYVDGIWCFIVASALFLQASFLNGILAADTFKHYEVLEERHTREVSARVESTPKTKSLRAMAATRALKWLLHARLTTIVQINLSFIGSLFFLIGCLLLRTSDASTYNAGVSTVLVGCVGYTLESCCPTWVKFCLDKYEQAHASQMESIGNESTTTTKYDSEERA